MFLIIFHFFFNSSFADDFCENKYNITRVNQTIVKTSDDDWQSWQNNLLNYRQCIISRNQINQQIYRDPNFNWSRSLFRQYFLFMYDQAFQENGHYKTASFIKNLKLKYGEIDSVLLWHAYPLLGFDSRTQFDFYKEMPGGISGLKKEVVDLFHKNGIRVFINFNPWDVGSYQELGIIVRDLDIDGVMLDTMNNVPQTMVGEINKQKKGVILMPETTPSMSDHGFANGSWAQWYALDKKSSSILFQKWVLPAHQLYFIRRWDTDRHEDILYSFFNGSGMLIWDNVFGAWNPYSDLDRLLLAQTGVLLKSFFNNFFEAGQWLPLVPTHIADLDLNIWKNTSGEIFAIFKNRSDHLIKYNLDEGLFKSLPYFAFWKGAEISSNRVIEIASGSVEAIVSLIPKAIEVYKLFPQKMTPFENDQERIPIPQKTVLGFTPKDGQHRGEFVTIFGGKFHYEVEHKKRESGCYPFGGNRYFSWGQNFEDLIKHIFEIEIGNFQIKKTAVTNQEFLSFVIESHYLPENSDKFLAHIKRNNEGELPKILDNDQAALPVTFVSLQDAQAYADWRGERLLSEEEWQYVASGAGANNLYPFGNDIRRINDPQSVNLTGKIIRADALIKGATPQGVLGLCGNTWELTNATYSDGHNKFVILRGGSYLPVHQSTWIIPRGPRANNFHAKYLLSGGGLDRSEAISFRTAY